MIEALKGTEAMNKMGGRFKLSALIQKRMLELMQGGRPLIEDTEGKTAMEIVDRRNPAQQDRDGFRGPRHHRTAQAVTGQAPWRRTFRDWN